MHTWESLAVLLGLSLVFSSGLLWAALRSPSLGYVLTINAAVAGLLAEGALGGIEKPANTYLCVLLAWGFCVLHLRGVVVTLRSQRLSKLLAGVIPDVWFLTLLVFCLLLTVALGLLPQGGVVVACLVIAAMLASWIAANRQPLQTLHANIPGIVIGLGFLSSWGVWLLGQTPTEGMAWARSWGAQLCWVGLWLLHLVWTILPAIGVGTSRARLARDELDVDRREIEFLRRTEESKAARKSAQRMADLQADFLATMSHELRTPLACIVGISRMLCGTAGGDGLSGAEVEEEEEDGGSEHQPDDASALLARDMGTIERLAVQLLRMVDEGLAFVRQQGCDEPAQLRTLRTRLLLRDMQAVGQWLAQQQHNRFTMHVTPDMPDVLECDERRLRQVLINLLSNASKYCRDGVITLGIAVLMHQNRKELQCLVADTGRGMTPEEQTLFFEPFTKSRDSQGLGLGLALVRRLVRELGGSITLDSVKEQGSQFRIRIPVDAGTQDACEESTRAAARGPSSDFSHSLPMALLPLNDIQQLNLARLRALIRLGQLSEIEQWVAHARTLSTLSEDATRLVAQVQKAVEDVNLDRIQRLIDKIDTPVSQV